MSEIVATTILLALTAAVVGSVSLGILREAHLARVTRIAETLARALASRESAGRAAPGRLLEWPPAPPARVPPFPRRPTQ